MSRFTIDPFRAHEVEQRHARVVKLYEEIGYPGTPKRADWLRAQRGGLPKYTVDRDPGDES